jgi:hypothetical protein
MKSDQKIEGKHNIKQIYETLRSKIKTCGTYISLKDFNKATKNLWNYIQELFEKLEASTENDKMDFSRYPFSVNYENHFYVLRYGTVEIDLENLVDRFQEIKLNLKNLSDFLAYQISYEKF